MNCMKAYRYNYRTKKKYPCYLPSGAVVAAGLNDVVQCAACGLPIRYGASCSSIEIQTESGAGYAVCPDCSQQELLRRLWMGVKSND